MEGDNQIFHLTTETGEILRGSCQRLDDLSTETVDQVFLQIDMSLAAVFPSSRGRTRTETGESKRIVQSNTTSHHEIFRAIG